ncbi:hypothetical protein AVEN_199842-1 [Araneus ventricosus]|uniref:Uncharacterized protein n=1 Tax=Araneus ventricosus TaxID=182803 RepID=A0A4Y2DS52_ARAVE|nr:hypothetical protein AVEN_199842-1 [Araneus ventricosus]
MNSLVYGSGPVKYVIVAEARRMECWRVGFCLTYQILTKAQYLKRARLASKLDANLTKQWIRQHEGYWNYNFELNHKWYTPFCLSIRVTKKSGRRDNDTDTVVSYKRFITSQCTNPFRRRYVPSSEM